VLSKGPGCMDIGVRFMDKDNKQMTGWLH
jgi:hypothetical protein